MYRKFIALLLIFAMTLGLFGCSAEPQETKNTKPPETTIPTLPPETEPAADILYSQARQAIDEAKNLSLEISTRKNYTVGQENFEYDSAQTLLLSGIGTDALQAQLSENLTSPNFEDSFEEYYSDGMLYVTVYDDYHFKGTVTQEEYLARFAPAVLLDASLYGEIISSAVSDGTLLQFEAPTGAENWALPEGAKFESASGSAHLDTNGILTQTTYTITYCQGAAHVTETVTVSPEVKDSVTLTAPDETLYTEISYIDGPRAYDMALIPLCSSESVSTVTTETIISQAAACVRSQQTNVNYHGTGAEHVSRVNYDVSLMQSASTDTYTQEELFVDGAYTVSSDDSEPQTAEVSTADMLEYCEGFLWENIVSLLYFGDVRASEVGGLLYLEMDYTEEYAVFLSQYISSVLFGDETFLDEYATAYATVECTGYMAIDLYTGFPTATGIYYSGNHTIDGVEYLLSVQADQSFHLASPTAYETVTEEPLPEAEPETAATPLFYHVTGGDGQEMWLLGTIHVGDARTAYLPQEIYDALDASDALAVEFDTLAFEESMETDSDLITQISNNYFYSDGSPTKDHLDAETYDAAVKLLKASGNYNANAEYMKPYLWSQSIDNFYLKLGYDLVPEKGVDSRLLTLAKEKGMEIRDIESGLFQVQMITGFSDELQALLLEESLAYSSSEFCAETAELYEMWCTGDEAALREALSEDVDTTELTEEELAEYEAAIPLLEEYNKAMSHDRNEGMLQAAIGYLESGETVFYAVGLAHLLNDVNGLVDTLRVAGYTVELVTYE